MSKSTKGNAVFLATVLVAGIIALSYPSILVGAQAQEYVMDQRYNSYKPEYRMNSYGEKESYEKDNSYDKSKDSSSVSVKKIKCNNINVNINGFNGLELNTLPPALNGLTTEALADEGEVGANSVESSGKSDGRHSGSDNDSRFVCINNNNFNVGQDGGTPVDDACDECFAELQVASPEVYAAIQGIISGGIDLGGFEFAGGTVDEFCEALSDFVRDSGAPLPVPVSAIIAILPELEIDTAEDFLALLEFIECLVAGDLIDIDFAAFQAAAITALPGLAESIQ